MVLGAWDTRSHSKPAPFRKRALGEVPLSPQASVSPFMREETLWLCQQFIESMILTGAGGTDRIGGPKLGAT